MFIGMAVRAGAGLVAGVATNNVIWSRVNCTEGPQFGFGYPPIRTGGSSLRLWVVWPAPLSERQYRGVDGTSTPPADLPRLARTARHF